MSENEPPVFWMHEQSGQMKEIVMSFLDEKELTKEQMKVLRWYLIQWIEKATFLRPTGYKDIINVSTQKELSGYMEVLLDEGIDPF